MGQAGQKTASRREKTRKGGEKAPRGDEGCICPDEILGLVMEKTSKREILLKLANKYKERGDEEKAMKFLKKLEDLLEEESDKEEATSDSDDNGNDNPVDEVDLLEDEDDDNNSEDSAN